MAYVPLGRERERDELLSLLNRPAAAPGGVVVVEGDGGSGKSTLVGALLDAARSSGAHHVLHGRSWELSASVPYESLVAAVSRHLRPRPADEVGRLTAGLPTLGALIDWLELQPPAGAPESFKIRAQDAFATLIGRIGDERPVVLALDDLHWADQASLEVLQYLSVDLPHVPLLLVVTVRPEEADRRPELRQILGGLRRERWTTTIRLGRLDRSAIDAIVADRLGGNVTPRVYETIAARSGGTPLLVHELLDDLTERGVVVREGPVWELRGEAPLTRSAADLIRTRLDRVQADDRAVLEALAVVNGPTDPRVVARLLGVDVAAVEGSLDRLRRIRLAVETEADLPGRGIASWTVEHPIIAAVVEDELVDAARRRLHRRLLDVDAEAPVGRRARHALAAGDPVDRLAAVRLLADAGTEALALATPAAAIDPLEGALALLHGDDDHALRHRIERDLGIACLRQLEVGRALAHLRSAWERAARTGDIAASLDLLHPLDNAEFRAGNGGVAPSALDELRSALVERSAWELLVQLGWVHLSHAGREQSTAQLHHAETALALVPPDARSLRGTALAEMLDVYRDFGRVQGPAGERVEHFLAAAEGWRELPDAEHRFVLLAFDAAVLSGDPELLARCQAAHRRIEERTGEPPTWRLPMVSGLQSIAAGRLDERPPDMRLFGAPTRSMVLAAVLDALALRYTDGPDAALALLDREWREVPGATTDRTARLYAAFGRLLLSIGTPAERDVAAAADAETGGDRVLAPAAGLQFGDAAALARGLSGGDTERVAAVEQLESAGAGRWLPAVWAHLLRARDAPSAAVSAAELLAAAGVLDGLGRTLEAAERVIDAAEADRSVVGDERLTAALATARDAGAGWLAGRVAALAPAMVAGPAVMAPGAADGPLTARELEVASLVAEGRTNREIAGQLFISIRTVTSHLDHIYTKLELSSRDALATWHRSTRASA